MWWTSKKCIKKWCMCRALVLLIKPMVFWCSHFCGFLSFLILFALQKDEAVIPSHHQVNCNCCQHDSGHTTNNNDSDKKVLWLLCFHWCLRPSTFHIFALQVRNKHFLLEFGQRVFLTKKGSCLTALWPIWFLWEVKEPTPRFKIGRGCRPRWCGQPFLGWVAYL